MDAPRYSPVQNDYQTRPGFPGQSNSLSQQLEQLFGLIRRQHLLIIVIIASTMAFGFIYLKTTPPTYSAHAKLIIDSSKVRALQQQLTDHQRARSLLPCRNRFRRGMVLHFPHDRIASD